MFYILVHVIGWYALLSNMRVEVVTWTIHSDYLMFAMTFPGYYNRQLLHVAHLWKTWCDSSWGPVNQTECLWCTSLPRHQLSDVNQLTSVLNMKSWNSREFECSYATCKNCLLTLLSLIGCLMRRLVLLWFYRVQRDQCSAHFFIFLCNLLRMWSKNVLIFFYDPSLTISYHNVFSLYLFWHIWPDNWRNHVDALLSVTLLRLDFSRFQQ